MSLLSRRRMLQLAAAAPCATCLPRWSMAAEPVAIGAGGIDVGYSVIYIGIKKGFFAEAGIAAEHINTQSGPRGKQMLAAGQVLATASGSSDSVALSMAGKPSVLIFNLERRPAAANLIVHKDTYDAGVKSAKDLGGKKIGITQPQGWTWLLAGYIAETLQIGKSVELKPLGDLTTMLAAVKSKSVDASIATFPMVERAVEEGWGVPIFQAAKDSDWKSVFTGDVPGNGIYVLKDTITQKPELVTKLASALVKASDFIKASSPEQIADVIQADYLPTTPRAALVSGISQYKEIWNYENDFTPQTYGLLLDIMGSGRMYPTAELLAKAPFAEGVDMSFVKKARGKA
jgi:NitT/TauT family transport system substrate-binding protein